MFLRTYGMCRTRWMKLAVFCYSFSTSSGMTKRLQTGRLSTAAMRVLVRGVHPLILQRRAKESLQARYWTGTVFGRCSLWIAAYGEVFSIKTASFYPSMSVIHTGSFFEWTSKRRLLRYMTQLMIGARQGYPGRDGHVMD